MPPDGTGVDCANPEILRAKVVQVAEGKPNDDSENSDGQIESPIRIRRMMPNRPYDAKNTGQICIQAPKNSTSVAAAITGWVKAIIPKIIAATPRKTGIDQ